MGLLERHQPTDAVAFGRGGDRTASELLADAAGVAAQLPEPTEGSHVLLVFKSDRYAFAAALLGAWSAGHAVALPPNTSRDAVLAVLGRPDVVAMLHDTDAGRPVRIEPFASGPAGGPRLEAPVLPDRVAVATVFTSGTEGAMTPCPKTAAQLLVEAAVLAEAFALMPGERLIATVQPGHIYGLLFSVLVPLVSGGAFMRETPFHAEVVARKVREHDARALVTVPAHLTGLTGAEPGVLSGLARVFSSTAPLRAEVARDFHASHGVGVTEILGSTETGGIACREAHQSEAWRPLPRVELDIDDENRLWVRSPFAGGESASRTADLARPRPDGSFIHLGRSDGVVKVGGQRVSLPAMEQWLCAQPGVHDAAFAATQTTGLRDVQLLAAVVAPGWTEARLRQALSDRFGPSVAPRRALLCEGLPREDNGKLSRGRLLALFGLDPEGRPIRWDLDWGETLERSEGGKICRRVSVHVPAMYGAFEGHFPGYPILAAAFQLDDLVMPRVRAERPDLGTVRAVRRLKFLGRIVPDDDLELELRWNAGSTEVDFEILRDGKACSGGRLVFEGGTT